MSNDAVEVGRERVGLEAVEDHDSTVAVGHLNQVVKEIFDVAIGVLRLIFDRGAISRLAGIEAVLAAVGVEQLGARRSCLLVLFLQTVGVGCLAVLDRLRSLYAYR